MRSVFAPIASIALLGTLGARAADHQIGEGVLSVHGSVFAGTAIRTADRDPKLLADVNSAVLSIAGKSASPSAGRNVDDGNLNFDRGDPVATVLKGYLSLAYTRGEFGIHASGLAWYDYATARSGHPWGNFRNGYERGEPLSDAGADPRSKFSGVALGSLYAQGHHKRDQATYDWRLGFQTLDWGARLMFGGGLRDLNPLDLNALVRPGAQREQEVRIAFPAVSGRVALAGGTSLEAFYQLRFVPHALQQCGTFYAYLDFVAEGCDWVSFGSLPDPVAMANGVELWRVNDRDASDAGQGGIAIRHTIESLATDVGLYAAQFHSRVPFYSGTKSGRDGAPFLPGNPDGLNPTYFIEYPERIRMYGGSVETRWRGGALLGELTYRPNQPMQYSSTDVMAAAVSLTAPTPFREVMEQLPPGGVFQAWERHETLQVQLGAVQQLPNVLHAAGASLGVEMAYKRVLDLPKPSVVRFRRSEMFGQGPVDGVCPPPAEPIACTFDGYASRNAFGYRLRAGLRYPDVWESVTLSPALTFAHDVSGWSDDGLLVEGRMSASLALQAEVAGHWTAAAAWVPTWGGTYNNVRDRSTAQLYLGYKF